MITSLSVFKRELNRFLPNEELLQSDSYEFNASIFITEIKSLLSISSLSYKDTQNYLLSVFEKLVTKTIIKSDNENSNQDFNSLYFKKLNKLYYEYIKTVFFFLSVSPSTNGSLISTRILVRIIDSIEKISNGEIEGHNWIQKNRLYDYIFGEIISYIERHPIEETFQIEHSFLLLILSKLGTDYLLSEDFIDSFFCSRLTKKDTNYFDISQFYFLIMIIRFYIRDYVKYNSVRKKVNSFSNAIISCKMNTPCCAQVLLLFDSLSCPYLDKKNKKKLLRNFFYDGKQVLPDNSKMFESIIKEIEENEIGFINWKNFKLEEELDLKRGQFVY